MIVLLGKSLMSSLSKLNANDTKRVTDFIDKFYSNPAHPSISLERVTKVKDDNLWSARITQGLRAIIYKESDTWALLYAGQHDNAYAWAQVRRVEQNAKTGALQIIEFTETIEQQFAEKPQNQFGLFDTHNDDYLLSLGLPPTWVAVIRKLVTEDDLLSILEKLPEEVAERFLRLAGGELVTPPLPPSPEKPIFENEDTQRRFIVVKSSDDIAKILAAPLATWIGFLHPSQRKLVTSSYKGPVKVTGSAGTGKTVVAMHRAKHLAQQGKKVLVTSFVKTLCDNINRNLKLLCSSDELTNITVGTVASQAGRILKEGNKSLSITSDEEIQLLIAQNFSPACPLNVSAVWLEWKFVIQTQGIATWEAYRSANRVGRGQPLSAKGRKQVWQIFESVLFQLQSQNKTDWSGLYRHAGDLITSGQVRSPFDTVIVDETQDLKPQELKFLAALAGKRLGSLMLVGDGGQRIYQGRLSLKSLGINVQGRSHVLKINYRTTEQIRQFADQLLDGEQDDLDGGTEQRSDTISLLNGPEPVLKPFANANQQAEFVAEEIFRLIQQGILPNEIGVFSRTKNLLKSIEKSLKKQKIACIRLDDQEPDAVADAVNTGSMHRAKGLEFKIIFVVHLSDDVIPSPHIAEENDLQARKEALEQEQHLLYVSITRARDVVYLCWNGQPSRFLKGIKGGESPNAVVS
ncbi:MAG: UvrD-helicase domain-containing protein [Myxacorys californica WJT36-NPBG1]|jgi:mRNA-degrading endonuclease RelE of RelBE toxin-antitoxin system|nr:UvrD-helicase domain-containing protein [Myxacorys californica WJT36-NPBG1]